MADRSYFVSHVFANGSIRGFLVSNEQRAISEFFTSSAALGCARALARLDCTAGNDAVVYEVQPLGRILLRWRCTHAAPLRTTDAGELAMADPADAHATVAPDAEAAPVTSSPEAELPERKNTATAKTPWIRGLTR